MKIGILTFHWATNYGAVLQAYALQTYLLNNGHEVKIINYKPYQWINHISQLLHARSFQQIKNIVLTSPKERALEIFRSKKLYQTKRIYKCSQIISVTNDLDVVISGSDQVFSTSFLENGDGIKKFTPSYYLGFPFRGKKITYAVSFGCTHYPESLKPLVIGFIKDLSAISVREKTGKDIIEYLGRNDAIVVPDPTSLLDASVYQELTNSCIKNPLNEDYIFCFFIRDINERRLALKNKVQKCLWNNDDGDYTLEGWLHNIMYACFVITDSFHCIMMCLKLHTPFVVVTNQKGNVGMNDRMYTLLNLVGLSEHILHKSELNAIDEIKERSIDWQKIDYILQEYQKIGVEFLKNSI